MLKKTLLTTTTAGLVYLVICGNVSGPYSANNLNRTGAASSSATCNGGGCHGNNNTNTQISIQLLDNNVPVTQYVPNVVYTVRIIGGVTNASLPKFGFQFASVKASDNATQAGTASNTGATAGVAIRTLPSSSALKQIVEHSTAIAGQGSGTTWAYIATFPWTAPAKNTGPVKMFLTLNAVNGNNSADGTDQPNATNVTINEKPVSVETINGNINVSAYPNPVQNNLHLSMDNATPGTYSIHAFDISGRKVMSDVLFLGSNGTDINTAAWAPGMYHLRISKDGAEKVISVVKQ